MLLPFFFTRFTVKMMMMITTYIKVSVHQLSIPSVPSPSPWPQGCWLYLVSVLLYMSTPIGQTVALWKQPLPTGPSLVLSAPRVSVSTLGPDDPFESWSDTFSGPLPLFSLACSGQNSSNGHNSACQSPWISPCVSTPYCEEEVSQGQALPLGPQLSFQLPRSSWFPPHSSPASSASFELRNQAQPDSPPFCGQRQHGGSGQMVIWAESCLTLRWSLKSVCKATLALKSL